MTSIDSGTAFLERGAARGIEGPFAVAGTKVDWQRVKIGIGLRPFLQLQTSEAVSVDIGQNIALGSLVAIRPA